MGLIAAVGTAVTAIASSIGVAVTATALTVGFETIAAVGIGLSVLGAVTHNKALSYVGLGLGLVGGIGALAAGAGIIGADAATDLGGGTIAASASEGVDASGDVVDSFADATNAGAAGAAGDIGAGDAIEGGAFSGTSAATDAAGAPIAATDAASTFTAPPPGADGTTFEGINQADATATTPTGEVAPATATAAPAPNTSMPPVFAQGADSSLPLPPPSPPGELGAVDPATGETITQSVGANGQIMTLPDQSSGLLGNITGFVSKNPLLTYGVLQAGGSLISGMTSGLTPAQIRQLDAQASANQAAANLTKQQTQNLQQPRSTATLAPVTGTPGNIITQPTAGIMNGPTANVTGVPA